MGPYKSSEALRGASQELLAAFSEPAFPVAGVDRLRELGDEAAAGLRVRVPGGFALAAKAADDDRLRPAVLLDPVLAVAEADPRLLPTAHRHIGGEVVRDHVVDVDG